MGKKPRAAELTKAEWSIIKAIWDSEPCTAPEIQARLAGQTAWTYSTVRTLMDRMAAKGILKSEKVNNQTVFRSALTRQQAQRGEVLATLKHAFNGALTPMLQCLIDSGDVSATELAELENLIKARRKEVK